MIKTRFGCVSSISGTKGDHLRKKQSMTERMFFSARLCSTVFNLLDKSVLGVFDILIGCLEISISKKN